MNAARAYETLGDTAAELQLFSNHYELQSSNRSRYFTLLARQRPDELLNIVDRSGPDASSLLATQIFIAAGDSVRAMQAIERQRRSPVWTNAYVGLSGLYFGSPAPEVPAAFQKALGTPLIQERLGKPVDRNTQLAGNIWFYYGQRYGEYLRDSGQPQAADDYLWSELEGRAGDPEAYLPGCSILPEAAAPDRAIQNSGMHWNWIPNGPLFIPRSRSSYGTPAAQRGARGMENGIGTVLQSPGLFHGKPHHLRYPITPAGKRITCRRRQSHARRGSHAPGLGIAAVASRRL